MTNRACYVRYGTLMLLVFLVLTSCDSGGEDADADKFVAPNASAGAFTGEAVFSNHTDDRFVRLGVDLQDEQEVKTRFLQSRSPLEPRHSHSSFFRYRPINLQSEAEVYWQTETDTAPNRVVVDIPLDTFSRWRRGAIVFQVLPNGEVKVLVFADGNWMSAAPRGGG